MQFLALYYMLWQKAFQNLVTYFVVYVGVWLVFLYYYYCAVLTLGWVLWTGRHCPTERVFTMTAHWTSMDTFSKERLCCKWGFEVRSVKSALIKQWKTLVFVEGLRFWWPSTDIVRVFTGNLNDMGSGPCIRLSSMCQNRVLIENLEALLATLCNK